MKTLILLLLTACTIQAQELDTICFTKPEYQALSDTLQKGERAIKIIPRLSAIINQQSDTIIKYSIRNAELQTSVLKYETAPKPKRGFWAMAGLVLGTLTGAILWAR
jgi:hypothetical protein